MTISPKTKFTAVSIFTGAGGLDIGFERAGFSILSALEIHPQYCATLHHNKSKRITIPGTTKTYLQTTNIINDDIHNVTAKELLCGASEVDCLIGGPPCQSFSSSGKQLSIFDQRGTLIYEYFRILKEMCPKTFLFENVRGLVTAKGNHAEPGEVLNDLLKKFTDIGYNCKVALLNSAEYGSYQRRVRCFIIGSRIAAAPNFPPPKYSMGKNTLFPEMNCKTLGQFLSEHSDKNEDEWVRPSPELATALQSVPAGKGLKSKGRIEATRPNGHWGYRQGTFIADPGKPARTITGSSSQDWIRLSDGSLRRITKKEAALLQGFPSNWEFCGTKANQFQQIGNAVPTVFGELLGNLLRKYLAGDYLNYPSQNALCLPENIQNNIRYTKYDNAKNGAYRANLLPVSISHS